MCAISSWKTRGSCRSPERATWPCCSARRTSPGRSACARWRAFRWLVGHAATCSRESWTPIGFPEPMRSPVIRDPGGGRPWTVEFPVGTTVHEARAAWSLRVSPDGNRVAFFEGPDACSTVRQTSMVTVIDKTGRKSTVSRGPGQALDWPGRHREARSGSLPRARASSRPDRSCMPSRSRESSAPCTARPIGSCYTTSPRTAGSCCPETPFGSTLPVRPPGKRASAIWAGWWRPVANGLSPDGQTLIFSDGLSGRTPAGNADACFAEARMAPPRSRLERPAGGALSPDGRWVLAELEGNLILLPAGAGSTVTLPKGDVVRFGRGAWLSDSKRIVFTGDAGDGKPRGYIQEIPAGLPRAITPVGVSLAGKAAVRDDDSVLGRVGAHVAALSDSRRRGPARASAQAWRYPASMEPRRPIRVYGRHRRGCQVASR